MKPAILVISSFVARGAVGARVSAFALERRGHPVWLLPTVVLPWHPGFGPGRRIIPTDDDFSAVAADLAASPRLGEVGAVLTGYFAHAAQPAAAARLIDAVRTRNPDAVVLCDPVIGDATGLYVLPAVAAAIRDQLIPRADIATPNRYELAWLGGRALASNAELAAAARRLGPATVITTSSFAPPGRIGTLMVTANAAHAVDQDERAGVPKGTGDYFAGALLAGWLAGLRPADAFRQAAAETRALIDKAVAGRLEDLPLTG